MNLRHELKLHEAATIVELTTWVRGVYTFSDFVQEALSQFPVDDFDLIDSSHLTNWVQEEAERVWNELTKRAEKLEEGYPFEFSTLGRALNLRSDWHVRSTYLFCLFLERYSTRASQNTRAEFETVAGNAIRNFFDCDDFIRYGANRRPPVPAGVYDALVYVLRKLGDGGEVKDELRRVKNGDLKTDIIAWKGLLPGSVPKFVILGGCATGKDWKDDNKYIEVRKSHIQTRTHGSWFSPVFTVFAVPFREVEDHIMEVMAREDTLLMSGWAIAKHAPALSDSGLVWVRQQKKRAKQEVISWQRTSNRSAY